VEQRHRLRGEVAWVGVAVVTGGDEEEEEDEDGTGQAISL
jgi:hypothetical protein